jgi:hypothetical protein
MRVAARLTAVVAVGAAIVLDGTGPVRSSIRAGSGPAAWR